MVEESDRESDSLVSNSTVGYLLDVEVVDLHLSYIM